MSKKQALLSAPCATCGGYLFILPNAFSELLLPFTHPRSQRLFENAVVGGVFGGGMARQGRQLPTVLVVAVLTSFLLVASFVSL